MSIKVLLRLISFAVLLSVSAFAVDGVVLINQATVMGAGGFPYHITQPGSYKLSGNLVVTTSADAIEVDADNVTLDLNGFTINDPAGIAVDNVVNGFFVFHPGFMLMNGQVIGLAGIQIFGATTIRNVSVTVSTGFGISLGGIASITDCTVVSTSPDTTQNGIDLPDGGLVSGNTVTGFNTGISGNDIHVTNNFLFKNNVGLFGGGVSGFGSNTFSGNGTAVANNAGTSMKNNVCGNQSVC